MPNIPLFRTGGVRRSLPFALLLIFLAVLWIAGGASRGDALGQVIVRSVAWGLLIVAIIVLPRQQTSPRSLLPYLIAAAALLPLLQLIDLPPDIWLHLPGRALFSGAMPSEVGQPWRPLSITPAATVNALSSLIVPVVTYLLLSRASGSEIAKLTVAVFWLVIAAMLIGLMQFAGAGFNNPFLNDSPGQVSGTFANRNHFALFLAMGCLLTPAWVFNAGRRAGWRGPVAVTLLILLILTILATGSRAGLILGAIATVLGLLIARKRITQELHFYPRWIRRAFIASGVGFIVLIIPISLMLNRAIGIDRLLSVEIGQDMRSRGLPTVLDMATNYFPIGAGFGSFDVLFRVHEPFDLLKPTYFNHAHNDFLEILIDGGILGAALTLTALAWWLVASIRLFNGKADKPTTAQKLGAAMLLLIILASTFDYPARTPMMMALIIVSAAWLNGYGARALPGAGRDL